MIKYEVIYSKRKSVALIVKEDETVTVRAPYGLPKKRIEELLTEKEGWIDEQIGKLRFQKAQAGPPLTEREKKYYRELARKVFSQKAAYFGEKMGVTYGRISIREQKTRWGSCSAGGNLNFNWRLMLAPEEVIDYVVVHELAHRKEMNHSRAFYRMVEAVIPDYKDRRKWLKEQGYRLWR